MQQPNSLISPQYEQTINNDFIDGQGRYINQINSPNSMNTPGYTRANFFNEE